MIYYYLAVSLILSVLAFIIAVVIRSLQNPEKNLVNSALSIALTPLRFFRLGPYSKDITLENSLEFAVKKTNLTDFGDDTTPSFRDAYLAIMGSPEYKSCKFTNIGFLFAQNEMNLTFARRLRFVQYLKDNKDVVDIKVPTPVFVIGLPRCGTTYMHRLLSLDPASRSPTLWELVNPIPSVPGTAASSELEADRECRAQRIRKLVKSRGFIGDSSLDHIHEIGADLPEECLFAMTDDLPLHMQHIYADYMNTEVFMSLDATKAYKWYRKVLQLLSYQVMSERGNPKRWALKSPIHLFYIKELAKAFPDAKLVWTHRHPISAVTSMCSVIEALHNFYFEKSGRDNNELGKRISAFKADILLKAAKDIEESKLDNFHVVFNDLVTKPKETVKKIYSQFGWKYSEEYDKILDEYLAKNDADRNKVKKSMPKSNKGEKKTDVLHAYSPEKYGLTAEQLSNGKFAAYIDKFNIPLSTF